jgi:hypothetical protein
VARRSAIWRWAPPLLAVVLLVGACTAGSDGTGATDPQPPSPRDGDRAGDPAPLVDPDEIISGGPPPDGIPPIDDPTFVSVDDVTFLEPQEPVIAVEVDESAKAYPVRILMWHEIVNDDFGTSSVVVTYCPLCNTGIAFERPTIDGELLDFGTSGKLYHSNLVMYDRQTGSYWPQATGLAVTGPLTGTQLAFVPARILSWADWSATHPEGQVLSIDTGFSRSYGVNPYVGYDDEERPFLYRGDVDPRLPAKARVLGIVGDDLIAIPYTELSRRAIDGSAVVQDTFGGRPIAVFWQTGTVSALDAADIPESRDVGAAAAYVPKVDGRELTFVVRDGAIVDEETGSTWSIAGRAIEGPLRDAQLEVALAMDSFWFDWAAFYPDTAVLGE